MKDWEVTLKATHAPLRNTSDRIAMEYSYLYFGRIFLRIVERADAQRDAQQQPDPIKNSSG